MKTISVWAVGLLVTISACTQKKSEVSISSSYALGGTDPVSYFTKGQPEQGSKEFSYEWKDATWIFSSRQHLDSFSANPDKYAPQYGGWCAYGCSAGRKATTDPNAWTIVNGKLYLNHSPTKKSRLKENIEAAEIHLSAEELGTIDRNFPEGAFAGTRYAAPQMGMVVY